MKAVVYKGNGEIALEDRPMPAILDERDAVVEVTLTTICSSDITLNAERCRERFPVRSSGTNLSDVSLRLEML